MKQAAAKAAILQEFRSLPEAKRESGSERLNFAMQMMKKYQFKSAADPYQVIMGWL
jgi:hypothetical protein